METYQTIELLFMLNLESEEELEQWMIDYQEDGNLPEVIMSDDSKKIVISPAEIAELLSNWENMIEDKEIKTWEEYDEEEFFQDIKWKCKHEWVATKLLVETVYDCKLCGAKKEEDK